MSGILDGISKKNTETNDVTESYWGGPSPAQLRFNRALKKQQNSPENKADREKFQKEIDRIMGPRPVQSKDKPEDKEITEAFDQPYPYEWDKDDFGDYHALAFLDDGSPLELSFSHEGSGQWHVTFDRNFKFDVTGEGDQQRVFATVLAAVKEFVQERQPQKIIFSATKSVKPGQKITSRAGLYNSLVNRYAAALGYTSNIDDRGDQVVYELMRVQKPVTESSGKTAAGYTWQFEPGREVPMKPDVDANTFIRVRDAAGKTICGIWADVAGDSIEIEYSQVFDERLRGRGVYTDLLRSLSKKYTVISDKDNNNAAAGIYRRLGADYDHRGARHTLRKQAVEEGKLNFEEGDCPIFAIALHRLSKMPLMALVEYDDQIGGTVLIHAYVRLDDRWRLDASGETDVDWMLQKYPNNGHAEEIEISEKDLLELGYGKSKCPTLQQVLPHAKEVLQNIEEGQQGVAEGSESAIQKIEKKIQDKRDALGLAREQRRMRKQHQQGQREIKIQAEIDRLSNELTQLKKQGVAEGLDQDVPPVLYHATYKPRLKSIKLKGLGAGGKPNWEDSQRGVVYLALDPNVAESYAETSDMVPEEWLDSIVILKISTTGLDSTKFQIDSNVQDNEGDTVEYHGVIPPSNISLYKQGVAEGATVTRIDSKPITDFATGLKSYKHTDDWGQSGLDTGDDSYWKNKNLKTKTTKGLFAGDPRRTALYATGNAHETRYVEFTQNGQPIVYFDKKDLPAIRSRKTYLTVFDAGQFKKLPTGEWFSKNPGKPIEQTPIGDPFKYIASQGWVVRVTDDLDKVFKQVQQMHKAGKIAHYGAEGMNESQQSVAEGEHAPSSLKTMVDVGGIQLNVAIDGAEVSIRPVVDGYQAGYVVFDRDGRTLVPDDLALDDEFRGRGIAKIIYDYVKSLGFTIRRSSDQTRAGKHFWDKNRGEDGMIWEEELDEACWKDYHKEGNKKMFGKTYPNCVKNTNEDRQQCPECGGPMFSEEMINEKKDACYYKVKSRYKVWPSAYASGALVQCRKKGASNWGTKSESSILEGIEQTNEDLHKWFKEKWVRFGPDGKIRGACARGDDSEGKPKCLPQSKAQNLGKKGRASAASRKRREDPNPERSGKAINVATKKKTTESSILQGISETKGLPMPGSYEQEYGPFKKKGGYRIMTLTSEQEELDEKWSDKYKRSIDCNHPKGFSQRAHCQGRKKK